MERNAQKTRDRILHAALTEFSSSGIAGARVDRIAASAQCNKQLIYLYFGGKEKLFEAVYEYAVARFIEDVAFDPYDLPGYVDQLCSLFERHPEAVRLEAWYRLERKNNPAFDALQGELKSRLEGIRLAQQSGAVTTRFEPEDLMSLLGSLALTGGLSLSREGGVAERASRESILEAARLLTMPDRKRGR